MGQKASNIQLLSLITPPITIKATAFKDGMNNSGMLEAEYTATPITTAEIDITAPTKGGIPVTAISGEEEHFTAGTVTWSPNDNPFKPGTEYTATVTLTAKDGYTFTTSTSAKINGQTASVSNNTGETIRLSYTFTATSTKSVSGIVISTQPANRTYTHGDTLVLSDMVVTLTYDDNTTEDVTGTNFINKGITANPSSGDKLIRSIHNGNPVTITYGSFSIRTSNLTVNAKNASALSINEIAAQTYTGSEIKPVITVKDGAETLTLTTDYTVSYSSNTNAGTATVTVTGKGDYTGNKTANFTINKANPTITAWPTAAAITYGAALSTSKLSGGTSTPAGTFAWTEPTTIPTVDNDGYSVKFTPTVSANYNTVTNDTISITVTPANLSGEITIIPNGTVIVTQLTATYSGSENVSYQWKRVIGTTNVGTNSNKYIPTASGSYTVTVSATNYNSKTSAAVTVKIWTAVSNTTFGTNGNYKRISAIAYGNGKFVAVGNQPYGKMAYSTDGKTWTAVSKTTFGTDTSDSKIYAITYGNGKFVAVGSSGKMAYSTNGTTWTAVSDSTFGSDIINAITYGDGKFVAVGTGSSYGKRAYSTDGVTWKTGTSLTSGNVDMIAYGDGKFVAVQRGADGRISTSTNGINWSYITKDGAYGVNISTLDLTSVIAIAYGNGKFVAVGSSGKIAYSTDCVTWTDVSDSTFGSSNIRAITYDNGKFVAGGYDGKMAVSTDGITWTDVPNSTFGSDCIYAITYGNGKFVAVGDNDKMAYWEDN